MEESFDGGRATDGGLLRLLRRPATLLLAPPDGVRCILWRDLLFVGRSPGDERRAPSRCGLDLRRPAWEGEDARDRGAREEVEDGTEDGKKREL